MKISLAFPSTLVGSGLSILDFHDPCQLAPKVRRRLACNFIKESIALYRQLDDPWNLAKSLGYVGNYAESAAEFAPAAAEARTIFRTISDAWGLAWITVMEHIVPQTAIQQLPLAESVRLMRTIGAQTGLALTLAAVAGQAYQCKDDERARSTAEEAIALYRQTGDKWTRAGVIATLGSVLSQQKQTAGVADLYTEGLHLAQQMGDGRLAAEFARRLADLTKG